ncbi:MAG: S8 family serine peptidase, partial [Deltaproteobacteria bacterium]|nr:S8 family serine peptidase [Deltaproteobacteria bacterium]
VQADIASQEAMLDVLAPEASANATGAGVTVAVLDGGFDTSHEAVIDAIIGGYDAIDDDLDVDDLGNGIDDDNDGLTDLNVGHGTFVASLIHAAAPDADILPIRVLDDEGHGTNLALWLGISKAVSQGADVINMSLVADTLPQGLKDAIDDATDADITMVISACNDPSGPLNHGYMANRAVVVGGADNDGALLSWSPTGGAVDIYAPAEGILGAIGGAGPEANSYATWDGTSFAAAFVSAGAALAKGAHSSLTSAQMQAHLAGSVSSMSGASPSTAGIIDLAAASN